MLLGALQNVTVNNDYVMPLLLFGGYIAGSARQPLHEHLLRHCCCFVTADGNADAITLRDNGQ